MTYFDWILIAIVIFFSVKSLLRGAAREVSSLLALVLAGYAAIIYYPVVLPFLQPYLTSRWAQLAAACLCLFIAVYSIVNIAGWLLSKLLKTIKLSFLDSLAGACIGIAKAYVIICCVIILVLLLPEGGVIIRQSALSSYSMPFIQRAAPYFPEPLKAMIQEKAVALKK